MKKLSFIWIFYLILFHQVNGQYETSLRFVGFEFGTLGMDADVLHKELFRADNSLYGYPYKQDLGLGGRLFQPFLGIKGEIRTLKNKIGLGGGLRYQVAYSDIRPSSPYYTDLDREYFFFLFNEQGTTTEYLRIKEISNISHAISIPLEIKYYPFSERFFRFFGVASLENSFVLKRESNVKFLQEGMMQYEDEVLSKFSKTRTYNSKFSIGAGVRLGKEDKGLNLHLEIRLPIYMTKLPSGLVDRGMGAQIQAGFMAPINMHKE